MSEALQRPSASFMQSCVFGVVSKLAVTIELSMSLTFPRWNVISLSRTFFAIQSAFDRELVCLEGLHHRVLRYQHYLLSP